MSNYFAIIPAAGVGKRFGGKTKKQFLSLRGKSLLEWTLNTFLETEIFKKIIVCLPPPPNPLPRGEGERGGWKKKVCFVEGGATRAESVKNGFQSLATTDDDVVLVHDAARPLVSVELIKRVAEETKRKGAVIPVIPLNDTIKEVRGGLVVKTVDRNPLFAVQTPQGFAAGLLGKAYQSVDVNDPRFTDEAAMIESMGVQVCMVEGERKNIKVTTPDDLAIAEYWLSMRRQKPGSNPIESTGSPPGFCRRDDKTNENRNRIRRS